MNKTEALKIGQGHIDQLNLRNEYLNRLTWKLIEPIETKIGFYFDYSYELIDSDNPILVGGAPGFVVGFEDKKIVDLSWEEYNNLGIGR